MFNGAFALLERSLRIDARSWSTHLVRLGLIGALYFTLCFVLATQDWFGAPGFRFFQGMAYIELAFMTLLGIGFFSTVITEEKEEDTLGLILMAGISPFGILAGKSVGRLWQAMLLVAVQYPFMLLAVTMGGVTGGQIWAATISLLAYMVFLSGIGLLCSTIASRSRTAGTMMIVALVAYLLLPVIARYSLFVRSLLVLASDRSKPEIWVTAFELISEVCIYLRMGEILTTGFGQSPWSIQVVSNVAVGFICSCLSWLVFGIVTQNPASEVSSRGLVARRRSFFRFTAGRPWSNPFLWKDFYFVAGGAGAWATRIAYYLGLGLSISVAQTLSGQTLGPGRDSVEAFLVFTSLSVAIDAGILLARSITEETRGQTLATLMMLPCSSIPLVYAKFAGALLGWLPGPIIELIVTLATDTGRTDLRSLLTNEHGGWALILLFALIPHFSVFVALYVRWGAVPLGIGMTFGVYFAIIGTMMTVGMGPNELVINLWAFVMVCLCLACHIGMLLRIQALGAK